MKNFKFNLLALLAVFVVSSVFMSCSNDDELIGNSKDSNKEIQNKLILKKSYNSYLNEALIYKDLAYGAIETSKAAPSQIEDNALLAFKSVNLNFDIESYKDVSANYSTNDKTSKGIYSLGLSKKAVGYFNQLIILENNKDYEGMVLLLNQYKLDYNTDSTLESLAGVFATIEVYKDELVNPSLIFNKGCSPSGAAVGGAAISGAISGAIWGGMLGSWLGPAGTVAGAVGGAVAGACISAIVSVVVQGVACES